MTDDLPPLYDPIGTNNIIKAPAGEVLIRGRRWPIAHPNTIARCREPHGDRESCQLAVGEDGRIGWVHITPTRKASL